MHFETDAFISYAHLDNVELIEGRKGWVANLHRALEVRIAQLLGKQPQIWRDQKLQGNDLFAETLIDRLSRVAILISIVSPRYVKSDWTRRELVEFWKSAEEQSGVRLRGKSRVFKVMKTPVPVENQTPELQSILGYEFFRVDPETGRVRELDEVFGPEAQKEFWLRLDDLAHDICALLETIETVDSASATAGTKERLVYLAETTRDLKEQREIIQRDLLQHGYIVLPSSPLPLVGPELEEMVRADLDQCEMSIHLAGKSYGLVPEGSVSSVFEIQNELAIERGAKEGFSRLLWIPHGMQVADERQQKVIEKLRMDPRIQQGADLLETSLEDLRTVYQERLQQKQKPEAVETTPQSAETTLTDAGTLTRLYLIYDQRDTDTVLPWSDFLFEQRLEVMHPVFEGDEAEVREYHEENLRSCDGALILYGAANELWLRRKLREVQKSAGYGRTKPMTAVGIAVLPPKTAEKERFRTHEAIVVSQLQGFSADPLKPFVSRFKSESGE